MRKSSVQQVFSKKLLKQRLISIKFWITFILNIFIYLEETMSYDNCPVEFLREYTLSTGRPVEAIFLLLDVH